MKKINFFSLLVICSFVILQLKAQESVNTAGGEANGSGGSVSYSVGQVVYTSNDGATGSVSQGVQQTYEITEVSSVQEATGINLTASAYPNPTTDYLLLNVEAREIFEYTAKLFDINGSMVGSEEISTRETKIDMRKLKQGLYLLKVIQDDKEIKIFKIIKN